MRSQVVSFHCTLSNRVGKVISSTFNHDVITQIEGGNGMLPGLAAALEDLKKGEKRRILLSAEQAYGFYDPGLVMECPRKKLGRNKPLLVGDEVLTEMPSGERKVFRVIEVKESVVLLDGNHPLAGQDLVFDI